MDRYSLAIPVAFILLAAVLCLLLIGSKWKWWQKLVLIVVVPGFGLVLWGALGSYKGWPTADHLPERSLVYHSLIREPEPKTNDPGAIYLWLVDLDKTVDTGMNPLEYAPPDGEPRAHRLPYTRKMHEALQIVTAMGAAGHPAVLDIGGKNGKGKGKGERRPQGDGDGQNGIGGMQGDPDRNDIQVYELPPPSPPEKNPE